VVYGGRSVQVQVFIAALLFSLHWYSIVFAIFTPLFSEGQAGIARELFNKGMVFLEIKYMIKALNG